MPINGPQTFPIKLDKPLKFNICIIANANNTFGSILFIDILKPFRAPATKLLIGFIFSFIILVSFYFMNRIA